MTPELIRWLELRATTQMHKTLAEREGKTLEDYHRARLLRNRYAIAARKQDRKEV
jgi:hypothetical protein